MRNKIIAGLLTLFWLTSITAKNATPLGIEIGTTSCQQALKTLTSKTTLTETGINEFSEGKIYKGDAKGLNIQSATSILLICNKVNIVSAIQLTLAKGNFAAGAFHFYG